MLMAFCLVFLRDLDVWLPNLKHFLIQPEAYGVPSHYQESLQASSIALLLKEVVKKLPRESLNEFFFDSCVSVSITANIVYAADKKSNRKLSHSFVF